MNGINSPAASYRPDRLALSPHQNLQGDAPQRVHFPRANPPCAPVPDVPDPRGRPAQHLSRFSYPCLDGQAVRHHDKPDQIPSLLPIGSGLLLPKQERGASGRLIWGMAAAAGGMLHMFF